MMRSKDESINVLLARWDRESVLEKEHLRENLEKLKPKTLDRMVEDLQPLKTPSERLIIWVKNFFS